MNKHVHPPTTLVIVGITGDLSRRKLLPAIASLHEAGELPQDFSIIGITRRDVTSQEVVDGLPESVSETGKNYLSSTISMRKMDLDNQAEYEKLRLDLDPNNPQRQRLFYLSVPPEISSPIVELLGSSGIASLSNMNTKLLLEKPFGSDYVSAKAFIQRVSRHFNDSVVYRIDHYLAKEMAQNIVYFRSKNALFKNTWGAEFIESIEVTALESIDIENRTAFYEQTGALRDLVQSHLLQLTALTLMNLPDITDWHDVQSHRLKALKDLRVTTDRSGQVSVIRGQYAGYSKEVANQASVTETFVSLELESNAAHWNGVPIRITTGKAMDKKLTEIRVRYRGDTAEEANELVLRIQPNEGIEIHLKSKRPGYDRGVETVRMSYDYSDKKAIPEAYEQVFIDAIHDNHSLFTTSEEVLESWRILDPVQKYWSMRHDDIILYPKGSSSAFVLQQYDTEAAE